MTYYIFQNARKTCVICNFFLPLVFFSVLNDIIFRNLFVLRKCFSPDMNEEHIRETASEAFTLIMSHSSIHQPLHLLPHSPEACSRPTGPTHTAANALCSYSVGDKTSEEKDSFKEYLKLLQCTNQRGPCFQQQSYWNCLFNCCRNINCTSQHVNYYKTLFLMEIFIDLKRVTRENTPMTGFIAQQQLLFCRNCG